MELDDLDIVKSLGQVEAKADSAHSRLDELRTGIREDLKEIKGDIADIKEWMHRTQGRDATLFVIGTVLGSVISFGIHKLFP